MTLKTLAALQEKAPKRPWEQSHRKRSDGMYSTEIYTSDGETLANIAWYPRPKDESGVIGTYRDDIAKFIAACGSFDFTALCDEMERMRGTLEFIAYDQIELSYDKAVLQRNDYKKRAREAIGGKDE